MNKMPQGSQPDMIWQFSNQLMHGTISWPMAARLPLSKPNLYDVLHILVSFRDVNYEIDRCSFTQEMVADRTF
jgi:hypothetical protein